MQWQGLSMAGAALGLLVLIVLVALLLEAVFIHLGARLVGLRQATFGRAFRAALYVWLLQVALSCLSGFLLGALLPGAAVQGALGSLVSLVAGTLAVKTAYEEGLIKSLLAYLVALVLTVLVLVGLLFAAIALGLLSTSAGGGGGTVAL